MQSGTIVMTTPSVRGGMYQQETWHGWRGRALTAGVTLAIVANLLFSVSMMGRSDASLNPPVLDASPSVMSGDFATD